MNTIEKIRARYRVPFGDNESIALFDLIAAAIGTELLLTDILGLTKRGFGAVLSVPLGMIAHTAVGVETPLNKQMIRASADKA